MAKLLALALFASCAAPQHPVPASAPVDIAQVPAGAFVAAVPGVYMTTSFFADLLAGVVVAEREPKRLEALANTVAALERERADKCEAKEQSWWEQNKFGLGLGIGGVITALLLGGVAYGVSH